jgi:hypothetical protein
MQTEAIFDNISNRIIEEIKNTNNSIYIAVAWFTNKSIFDQLLLKAKEGCRIQLIISNDEINNKSLIDFQLLEKLNGKVYKIGNGNTELMHNKFCVIDHNTVITGSYNWSYKAENNHENIVVNSNNTNLAEQFINEFNIIVSKYYPSVINSQIDFPINQIIKRLDVIKNLMLLEEFDDLRTNLNKLMHYDFNNDIGNIIISINNEEYGNAIKLIESFISNNNLLMIWNDPEISGIKLEIKILENQINAFDNEKIELEKILSDFEHRHTLELGTLILEVLRLRKIKYINHSKQFETEKDFNDYQEQFENEKEKKQYDLTEEEKITLKKTFRKATTFCHPDKVNDEQKEEAQRIFIELKKAYDEHDLVKINQILNDLETGKTFKTNSDSISEKEKLKTILNNLKKKVKQLEKEIIELKNNETFEMILKIDNWDSYFSETKNQLTEELQKLTLELQY